MKAVILQPFYLPWIGYFGMIDTADIFVFADDIQFLAKSWHRRNRIKNGNAPKWLTVPVNKHYGQMINQVNINNSITYKQKNNTLNWKEKHWELISSTYQKAPYFDDYKEDIHEIYTQDWDFLCDLDIYIIEKISKLLKLKLPQFIKKSDINGLEGKKTDSIINICNKIGANKYVSGPAAKNYIDYTEFQKFKQNNIDLYWYEFPHPLYPQIGTDFLPYLSVIDILFNVGEESRDYIRKSSENCLELEDGNSLELEDGNSLELEDGNSLELEDGNSLINEGGIINVQSAKRIL